MNPILFLCGYRRVRAWGVHTHRLLELCRKMEIDFIDFCGSEDEVSFLCSLRSAKRLSREAERQSFTVELQREKGLPVLWRCLLRRWGLMVGLVCGVALMILSQQFVWDIRVTGNETLTVGEVKAELAAQGFGVGSPIAAQSMGSLENRVLMASDRLSWISIHMEGTVAMVQVVERIARPQEEPKGPANLVAACDGQIETVELLRGECMVKHGQAVRAGELLVSGIYDSQTVGVRFTRAAGRVMARTEHCFLIEIPLETTKKVYSEAPYTEISLNFFQKSMKIFKSTGNHTGACDIIEKENHFTGLGLQNLPVWITLQSHYPYEKVQVRLDYGEAEELAYAELEHRLSELAEDAMLIGKEISVVITEESVILECTVRCIENIAVQVEVELAEP